MYKGINKNWGGCILSFQPRLENDDIQYNRTGCLFASDYKGARCVLMIEPINYAIDSVSSNSMKSSNPKSGVHKEDYVKTIDTNGNNPACNQGGNMIVYALQGNMIGRDDNNGPKGKGYKEDEMYTLNTIDRHGVLVAQCFDSYNNALTNDMTTFGTNLGMSTGRNNLFVIRTAKHCESVAGVDPACENYERIGEHNPMCKHCVIPTNDMVATRYKTDDGRTTLGVGKDGDPLPSITSNHSHAVCYYNNSIAGYKEGCGGLKASGGDLGGGSENLIVQPVKLRVRKITERESLKLMGLPDDWFNGANLPKTKQYEKIGNGLVTGRSSYWWYMWQNIYKLLGKEKPTLFSQFNGVGMTEYITEDIGFQTVYTSEIDEAANKAYVNLQRKGRLDRKTRNLGDITKVSGYEIKPCDVIFSSSPCQSFSNAGKGEGEDGASGLIWQTIRTAKEMLDATNGRYPQVIATENVAGELSHKDFLTKFLIALDRLGYAIDIQLHNALDYNVAQSRERVSIVAIKKDLSHDNDLEEHRHKRVQRVLKEINADIELFSGIATFPHKAKTNNLCDFLDTDVSEEYDLSEKACIGILRRSFQRKKEIPAILAYALIQQSGELYYEKEYKSAKGKVNGDELRKWYKKILDKGLENMELPVCLENHSQDTRFKLRGDTQSITAKWGTGGNNQALILEEPCCFGGGSFDVLNDRGGVFSDK